MASAPVVGVLDPRIARYVEGLRDAGVETFESCEGGPGHAYPEPTVRFYGNHAEGFRAFAVAFQLFRHDVRALRRVWLVETGELSGPCWELTFRPQRGPEETVA